MCCACCVSERKPCHVHAPCTVTMRACQCTSTQHLLSRMRRHEIIVRGIAYVHSTPQRSIQQVDAGSLDAPSRVPSLDDVDTVMGNLEGLCQEARTWSQQDAGLGQCMQV